MGVATVTGMDTVQKGLTLSLDKHLKMTNYASWFFLGWKCRFGHSDEL